MNIYTRSGHGEEGGRGDTPNEFETRNVAIVT